MRISIIGAGNMGGAIACGLIKDSNIELTVIDHHGNNVDRLKKQYPAMNVVVADYSSLDIADTIILAVKPWNIEDVVYKHVNSSLHKEQIIISVAAGVSLEQLETYLKSDNPIFRVIPNTAISCSESMTFICSKHSESNHCISVEAIFKQLGKVLTIDESEFTAASSLSSCGIAFAFRYIRAAMEGGVEIGFKPSLAQKIVVQTLKGAISILEESDVHPEAEIDKVTTAGGITIKGLNAMEEAGFTASVIKGLKASNVDH